MHVLPSFHFLSATSLSCQYDLTTFGGGFFNVPLHLSNQCNQRVYLNHTPWIFFSSYCYFASVVLDAKFVVCCIFFCGAIRMEKLALVISSTAT